MTDQHGNYSDGRSTASVSFSPDGNFLAEGADYKLHIWRVLDNGRLLIYRNIDISQYNYARIYQVAISPDGKLVSAAFSTGVGVWDLATGVRVFNIGYSHQMITGLAWSTDSNSITIASNQPGIQQWDVNTGESLVTLDFDSGTFSSLAWSPDGQKLAVGAEEGEADVINYQDGELIQSIGSGYQLNSLAFSPDSQTLAVGYGDRIVNIWDVTGTISLTLEGVGYGSTDVTFSTDGTFFAATTAESWQTNPQVRFWNTRNWSVEKAVSIGKIVII